jgi:hypothetical protein
MERRWYEVWHIGATWVPYAGKTDHHRFNDLTRHGGSRREPLVADPYDFLKLLNAQTRRRLVTKAAARPFYRK